MENKVAIGIDLGTTYSCVAAYVDGDIKIFTNDAGNRTMPSCVTILEDQRIIGEFAKENYRMNLKNTIFDAKRLIGRKYDDPQVQADKQYLTYDIVECYDQLKIEIPWGKKKRTFFPEEISAMVLAEMKKIAESGINQEVTDAVITVPAHFNNSQRQATIDAARIAGLNVLTIINEPTAAALAYNYKTKISEERNILVYDLGGGTFDVSIFSMKGSKITKKATGGDTHLGGEDFVNRMVKSLIEEIKKRYKIDINTLSSKDRCNVLRRLHNRCEIAKKSLSSVPRIDISIDCIVKDINFCHTIYQAQFEMINNDYFEKTIEIVNECLKESQLEKDEIDEIILVGGSSRIPKIQRMLEDYFDNKKNLNKTLNPDEVVAYGAAIQAATYLEEKSKEICDLSLLDMTPLALGVGSKDGVMSVVVEKNTVIPTKKTKLYSTTMNNQSSMLIKIYEGERSMIEDNDFLGEFELTNIPKAPRGVIKIKVTFDIDANSILTISAAETSKGMENNITIADNKGRLTHEDIDKLIREAETFKLQDEKRKNQIICKNNLIRYCYDMMKLLNDSKKTLKITTDEKIDFLKKIAETLDWAESHTFEEVAEYANKRLELENDYKAFL